MAFRKTVPIFLDSTKSSKSNSIGNVHTWRFDAPINLIGVRNPTCCLQSATIPYTWVNINETNNIMMWRFTLSGTLIQLTFAKGIYSIDFLNDAIYNAFVDNYAIQPNEVPQLSYNGFDGRLILIMPAQATASLRLEYLPNNTLDTIAEMLGFQGQTNLVQIGNDVTYDADSAPRINNDITNAVILCNIITNTYLNTASTSNAIANIYPNVGPLGIIIFEPSNLLKIPIMPNNINEITISIMKSNGVDNMDLQNEQFSMLLVIEYEENAI